MLVCLKVYLLQVCLLHYIKVHNSSIRIAFVANEFILHMTDDLWCIFTIYLLVFRIPPSPIFYFGSDTVQIRNVVRPEVSTLDLGGFIAVGTYAYFRPTKIWKR